MTFSSPSLLRSRSRFSRLFTLSVLAGMVSTASALSAPQRVFSRHAAPQASLSARLAALPYLQKLGATPLRFAAPPAEPVERPVASESLPASATAIPTEAVSSSHDALALNPPVKETNLASAPRQPVKLLSIIPDDTPRDVHAEDVMSYFQLPKLNEPSNPAGINLPFTPAQPTSSTLPLSSATYQLK